jgi:hypothetical protein
MHARRTAAASARPAPAPTPKARLFLPKAKKPPSSWLFLALPLFLHPSGISGVSIFFLSRACACSFVCVDWVGGISPLSFHHILCSLASGREITLLHFAPAVYMKWPRVHSKLRACVQSPTLYLEPSEPSLVSALPKTPGRLPRDPFGTWTPGGDFSVPFLESCCAHDPIAVSAPGKGSAYIGHCPSRRANLCC